jgi:hypothetical protein
MTSTLPSARAGATKKPETPSIPAQLKHSQCAFIQSRIKILIDFTSPMMYDIRIRSGMYGFADGHPKGSQRVILIFEKTK